MWFHQSHTDPCVFRKLAEEEIVIILGLYVDGLLALTTTLKNTASILEEQRFRY